MRNRFASRASLTAPTFAATVMVSLTSTVTVLTLMTKKTATMATVLIVVLPLRSLQSFLIQQRAVNAGRTALLMVS
ncbi:MAG: hypothetical protein MPK06_04720, partial [Alphaproteobacteria bacterium]|nr:hypothetical protein [Alphaproteobacteria bacterium]MDA8005824.1 hypothetical protein [Alphaproteobacteria bacterium]